MMAPRATWSFKGCNSSHAYYKADQEAVLEHSSFDTPKLLMVSGVVHEAGEFGDVWEYSRSGVLILECSTCISAHPTILFRHSFLVLDCRQYFEGQALSLPGATHDRTCGRTRPPCCPWSSWKYATLMRQCLVSIIPEYSDTMSICTSKIQFG
jgi:hypothetical protein